MTAMTDNLWTDAEIIGVYTRKHAIADGVLVDLTQADGHHFNCPFACTAAVWSIIDRAVKNKRCCNDLAGILHDICHMSKVSYRELGECRLFQVIITGAGRQKIYTLKLVAGPGDDGLPCITLMLQNED